SGGSILAPPREPEPSPVRRYWSARHDLIDSRPGGGRGVRRKRISLKKTMRRDFVVRQRGSRLMKPLNHEQHHVIAPRQHWVEIDPKLFGRTDKIDVAFLLEFTRKGLEHRLARLNASAREMPTADIGVLDQEHAALLVDDEAAYAERQST